MLRLISVHGGASNVSSFADDSDIKPELWWGLFTCTESGAVFLTPAAPAIPKWRDSGPCGGGGGQARVRAPALR